MADRYQLNRALNNHYAKNYRTSYTDRPDFSINSSSSSQRQQVPEIRYNTPRDVSQRNKLQSYYNLGQIQPRPTDLLQETSNPASQLQAPIEKLEIKKSGHPIKYTKHYAKNLQITSKDRNFTSFPTTSNFRICFEKIRNVVEIELVSAILPNQNDILDEPYLIIEIDELPSNIEFSCRDINKAFAMLPLKKPNKDTGGFIVPELGQNYKTTMKFKTPLASIDQFTISIKDMDGALFDFGTDTAPGTKSLQTTFMFKITTLEADLSEIQTQAIF